MTSKQATPESTSIAHTVHILALAMFLLLPAGAVLAKNGDLLVGTCQRDITPISPGLAAAYEAQFGTPAVVNNSDPIFLAGFGNDRQAACGPAESCSTVGVDEWRSWRWIWWATSSTRSRSSAA